MFRGSAPLGGSPLPSPLALRHGLAWLSANVGEVTGTLAPAFQPPQPCRQQAPRGGRHPAQRNPLPVPSDRSRPEAKGAGSKVGRALSPPGPVHDFPPESLRPPPGPGRVGRQPDRKVRGIPAVLEEGEVRIFRRDGKGEGPCVRCVPPYRGGRISRTAHAPSNSSHIMNRTDRTRRCLEAR